MLTVHDPHDVPSQSGTIVTIGNFDGVHKGHQSLILRVREECTLRSMTSVVVTFWPHPRCVVSPHKIHRPLTTRSQRLTLLQDFGVDCTLELPFTTHLANLSPQEFVDQYLMPLNLRHLVTGYDFSLGRGRSGHTAELKAIGLELGFSVEQMPKLMENGDVVSSTRLRDLIATGEIDQCNHLLGRPYSISGEVVHGFGRGRKLGFPTANLKVLDILLPATGVYAAYAEGRHDTVPSLVNIGHNPTFGTNPLSIECFLLEGGGDLYGTILTLSFLTRLRPELRFQSPQELTAQIKRDLEQAHLVFQQYPGI